VLSIFIVSNIALVINMVIFFVIFKNKMGLS